VNANDAGPPDPGSTARPPVRAEPPAPGRTPADAFAALVELMRILRSPEGCPWDREQTIDTLKPFVLEEAHEVVDAIERGDLESLKGEIGDLVFEGVFLAQLCSELPPDQGAAAGFTITDALNDVRAKLVRRHPHVFAADPSTSTVTTAGAVKKQWDEIKADERAARGNPGEGLFDRIPRSLPSLLRAHEIGVRAASVGFDWPQAADVLDKVAEELGELRAAVERRDRGGDRAEETGTTAEAGHDRTRPTSGTVDEELGDLLFAIANLARKLGIDPEVSLRDANRKFLARFDAMRERLASLGIPLGQAGLDEMEAAWQEVKGSPGSSKQRRP
jgi:nucleoside triphosphate diphosphatase